MKCIALDDEPWALEVLQNFASEHTALSLQNVFTSSLQAAKYLRKFPVDLIFLDIQMPDISGLDFLKSIDQSMMVIFTTAYSKYAVEAFNLQAVDYLLKPFEKDRFMQSVDKAEEYYNYIHNKSVANTNFLFVRSEYSLQKINLSDIQFIEGMDDYIKIHTQDQKPVVTRMSMKAVLEKLPNHQFLRVHRSFIVPMAKIITVRNKKIQLEKVEIPIGVSHEEEFMKSFLKGELK